MTAAHTTGPASGPRPTSSTPAMHSAPRGEHLLFVRELVPLGLHPFRHTFYLFRICIKILCRAASAERDPRSPPPHSNVRSPPAGLCGNRRRPPCRRARNRKSPPAQHKTAAPVTPVRTWQAAQKSPRCRTVRAENRGTLSAISRKNSRASSLMSRMSSLMLPM